MASRHSLNQNLAMFSATDVVLNLSTSMSRNDALNVFGQPLQPCSHNHEAITGFTRDGRCADLGSQDAGSHHICIKMPKKDNFCTVTGQSNWCSGMSPCMGEKGDCPIEHWCVCQWAFASYIEKAGGCHAIDEVVCAAINKAAVTAYEGSSEKKNKDALACIKEKCVSSKLADVPTEKDKAGDGKKSGALGTSLKRLLYVGVFTLALDLPGSF